MKGTVIIDPPWPYQEVTGRKAAGYSIGHYKPMSLESLSAIPVADLGSYLFLWSTVAFVESGFQLVRKWGFTPVTMLFWVKAQGSRLVERPGAISFKPRYGVGYWFRGACEPILVAKKPGVKSIRTPWLGLLSDNAVHSRKPESLHLIVEQHFPKPYVELFGRQPREGWVVLGDEVQDGMDITKAVSRVIRPRLK